MSNPVCAELVRRRVLHGQVAVVTGSTRGIGREMVLLFAKAGANVVVCGKSSEDQGEKLPGTIFSVAREAEELGVKALAVKCDVRKDEDVEALIASTMETFGRIDILVCNAGALWWRRVEDTPMSRFDLMQQINARASFACVRAALPHMQANPAKRGHIIVCSPPIDLRMLPAHGLGMELAGTGVAVNALWPATTVESQATINFKTGERKLWRKASVVADAALLLVSLPASKCTARALVDEEFMREFGVTDFSPYRCDPDVEPPRMTPIYRGRIAVHGADESALDGKPLWLAASQTNSKVAGLHIDRGLARSVSIEDERQASEALLQLNKVLQQDSAHAPSGTSVRGDDSEAFGAGEAELALSDFEQVHAHFSHAGKALWLELQRPRKLNAFSARMLRELRSALRFARQQENIVCVVFTGSPNPKDFFTAGFDISEFAELQNSMKYSESDEMAEAKIRSGHAFQFFIDLMSFPKIAIAAVNGPAVGLGVTMLPLCDVAVATENAMFRTPFVELGLCPEAGSSIMMASTVGTVMANEILLLGRTISSSEALRCNLVSHLFPDRDNLFEHVDRVLNKFIAMDPDLLYRSKKLLRDHQMPAFTNAFNAEAKLFSSAIRSPYSRSVMQKFLSARAKL